MLKEKNSFINVTPHIPPYPRDYVAIAVIVISNEGRNLYV